MGLFNQKNPIKPLLSEVEIIYNYSEKLGSRTNQKRKKMKIRIIASLIICLSVNILTASSERPSIATLSALERSERRHESEHNHKRLALIYLTKAKIYLKQGNPEMALKYTKKTIELSNTPSIDKQAKRLREEERAQIKAAKMQKNMSKKTSRQPRPVYQKK